jgi:hypothetical protein
VSCARGEKVKLGPIAGQGICGSDRQPQRFAPSVITRPRLISRSTRADRPGSVGMGPICLKAERSSMVVSVSI